jgi:hypothetical protein
MGMIKIDHVSTKFEIGVEFSNGWEEFGPK